MDGGVTHLFDHPYPLVKNHFVPGFDRQAVPQQLPRHPATQPFPRHDVFQLHFGLHIDDHCGLDRDEGTLDNIPFEKFALIQQQR
jgi:hypothetical protein